MEREACVCDHGFERSDLCAEIIIIIIIRVGLRTRSEILLSRLPRQFGSATARRKSSYP